MKKQQGFTLIELMVVMAIIAILATAGLSAYTGYIKKARDTVRGQIAQQIETVVMSLLGSNGGQAPDGEALTAALEEMSIGWNIAPTLNTPLALLSRTLGNTSENILNHLLGFTVYATSTPIRDPNGGKPVCLDVDGTPNQPCRFDYVKYNDGTYSISYGIESKASMDRNFYQTLFITETGPLPRPKVGVYHGNAPFIGSKPLTSAGTAKADLYKPTQSNGTTILQSDSSTGLTADNSSHPAVPLNEVVIGSGDGGGEALTCDPVCAETETCDNGVCKCGSSDSCTGGAICVNNTSCVAPPTCGNGLTIGGYGTTRVVYGAYDKCWLNQDLSGLYQWQRKNAGWFSGWAGNGTESDYGDPCPIGTHTPTQTEWAALANAIPNFMSGPGDRRTIVSSSLLNLTANGYLHGSTGVLTNQGSYGYYWSSSPNGGNAFSLAFYSGGVNPANNSTRAYGFSVRCIQD